MRRLCLRIWAGIKILRHSPRYIIGLAISLLIAILITHYALNIDSHTFPRLVRLIKPIVYFIDILGVSFFYLLFVGGWIRDLRYQIAFRSIGFVNGNNIEPIYLYTEENLHGFRVHFDSSGIPLSLWSDKIDKLQSAFNITISRISIDGAFDRIVVDYIAGSNVMDAAVYPSEPYSDDTTLLLGEAFGNIIRLDLLIHPHLLIGGATGSGKTYLLKHLIYQCTRKGYVIYLADFKGLIDYCGSEFNKCIPIESNTAAFEVLSSLRQFITDRQSLYRECRCKDISEYQHKFPLDENHNHIVFVCDELASMLDSSGMSKEEKELRTRIIGQLSEIARLGRAFGIHLILCTQRPDADVVPGQIKNNITYRICGRADDVLSRIVLDNSSASDMIPPNSIGIFVNQDGELFKGYSYKILRFSAGRK